MHFLYIKLSSIKNYFLLYFYQYFNIHYILLYFKSFKLACLIIEYVSFLTSVR